MKALIALLLGGAKLAKFGKLLTTGGTMLLSVFVYAGIYGWRYAVGFIALLLCHEMGHYVAARQRGLDVGAPTFIPFVGAWIELKEQPMNAETEAYIGMAGPLTGTVAALACYFLARNEGSQLLLAVAYSGFFLNLFNLIPVPPLDGGRMTAVISRKMWLLGAPLLIGLFFWRPSPMLILIALLAAPQLWRALKGEDAMPADYYAATPAGTRAEYALIYLGLVSFLAVMSHDVYEMLGGA
ncbi:site-2 protease family protein [Denitromonas ohlonensis]|jgi:Zn-dependent protease|uniref:Site-2 protease family protein n=2 Tax=Denitromonas TaxID=139331 RepID=A0A557SE85_9RHOO|nr:site-2 protease family protein [Denitromonas ohlonensis]TVO64979.1 site-2 protease family protein [Denitromonas ohlonensis]TVO75652.1 site-2 protease family protein [Denitromonas ohlonensis]